MASERLVSIEEEISKRDLSARLISDWQPKIRLIEERASKAGASIARELQSLNEAIRSNKPEVAEAMLAELEAKLNTREAEGEKVKALHATWDSRIAELRAETKDGNSALVQKFRLLERQVFALKRSPPDRLQGPVGEASAMYDEIQSELARLRKQNALQTAPIAADFPRGGNRFHLPLDEGSRDKCLIGLPIVLNKLYYNPQDAFGNNDSRTLKSRYIVIPINLLLAPRWRPGGAESDTQLDQTTNWTSKITFSSGLEVQPSQLAPPEAATLMEFLDIRDFDPTALRVFEVPAELMQDECKLVLQISSPARKIEIAKLPLIKRRTYEQQLATMHSLWHTINSSFNLTSNKAVETLKKMVLLGLRFDLYRQEMDAWQPLFEARKQQMINGRDHFSGGSGTRESVQSRAVEGIDSVLRSDERAHEIFRLRQRWLRAISPDLIELRTVLVSTAELGLPAETSYKTVSNFRDSHEFFRSALESPSHHLGAMDEGIFMDKPEKLSAAERIVLYRLFADGESNPSPTVIHAGVERIHHWNWPEIEKQNGGKRLGSVEIEFIVNKEGRIENVKVLKAVGPVAISAIRDLLKEWKFKPGVENGRPVAKTIKTSLQF